MRTITNGVHQVSRGVNAFIVDGDDGVTLIDTGLPKRHGAIEGGLREIGRTPQDVTSILITHAHVDHVGGAAALVAATGAELFIGERDAPAARAEVEKQGPPVLDRVGFLKPLFKLLPDSDAVEVHFEITESNQEGLPQDFQMIETPGHTRGHASYLLNRDGGVLFVGDAALRSRKGTVKRGYMNRAFPTFDDSIRRIAGLDFEIACFGHSAPITTGARGAFQQLAKAL